MTGPNKTWGKKENLIKQPKEIFIHTKFLSSSSWSYFVKRAFINYIRSIEVLNKVDIILPK